ncbi:MAG TPA: UDP-N-acetylmuramoyl-L-alanyl-D-glutamate--2,6-diaminopimelate ligase [bacterium]|nr:UDP-N-acetylmuramoyl-L-alanyl-D-glutamate--2,6-diaminopimelate ligase [bacterium]
MTGTQHTLLQKVKNCYHWLEAWYACRKAGFPGRQLYVIGVTGTDGKTSTTTMIYHLLAQAGKKVALINTIQACIGTERLETGLHVTTQNPRELQPLLRHVLQEGYDTVVLEVTSHGLDQHRVWGINFSTAVVTNIKEDHLDYHGSYEAYLQAKAQLFFSLRSTKGKPTTTVLNQADASFSLLSQARTDNRYVYSLEAPTALSENIQPLWAEDIHQSAEGIAFILCSTAEKTPTRIPLIGRYNVENALAAAGAVVAAGISQADIALYLPSLPQIKGRMQRIDAGQPFQVVVDFAHTPAALSRALPELKRLTNGKLIVLFGCAGERDSQRRRMGTVAAKHADYIVITNEDNRTEPVDQIMSEIAAYAENGGARAGDPAHPDHTTDTPLYFCIPDRREAIRFALRLAQPDDLVDITGKGHEQSLNVDGRELDWDDAEETKTLIQELYPAAS